MPALYMSIGKRWMALGWTFFGEYGSGTSSMSVDESCLMMLSNVLWEMWLTWVLSVSVCAWGGR